MATNIYFYSFILLISMIFLNIFIDIILKAYFQTIDREKESLNRFELEKYRTAWAKFDPNGAGVIEPSNFPKLMFELGRPLGWDDSYKDKPHRQNIYFKLMASKTSKAAKRRKMTDPERDNYIHFNDLLDNLAVLYAVRDQVKKEMREADIEMDSVAETESEQPPDEENLQEQVVIEEEAK